MNQNKNKATLHTYGENRIFDSLITPKKTYSCMKKIILQSICCLALLAGIVSFTSCKDDDYAPISLVIAPDSSINFSNNALSLSPFSPGVTFHIQGGDGSYIIASPNTAVIDYRYNGDELTVIPKGLGKATLNISDRSWNTYSLQITVAYPETTYGIESVEGIVDGGELTQNQLLAIKADIESNSLVQAGGKYVFTYTEKDFSAGIVTIYPSASDNHTLHGIFTKSVNGNQEQIHIELTDGNVYDYILTVSPILSGYHASRTEIIPERVLLQDVTGTYQSTYPALEKAYCVLHIPGEAI